VDPATGVVTAATVQSNAETTVPVVIDGDATADGFSDPASISTQVTVRTRVASIAISGGGPVALGTDRQLTAVPSIVSGSPASPAPIMSWTSSNPTAVAVSNTGRVTVNEAVTGAVIITASSEGRSGTTEINVTGVGDPLAITTTGLPNATIGSTYSAVLAASGGPTDGVKAWALASGTLPTGVTLGSNGVLTSSNVSATAGTYNFVVRVTSTVGVASVNTTKALSITVSASPLFVTISPPGHITTIGGTVDFTLTQTDASGNPVGTPPAVTWSLSSPTTALVLTPPGRFRGESNGGTIVRATTAGGVVYSAALTVGARGSVAVTVSQGTPTGTPADGASLEAFIGSSGVLGLGVVGANRIGVVPGLSAGTYSIRVIKAGFVTQTINNVVVTAGNESNAGLVVLIAQ
jgi:hypothetical protein